MILDDDLFETVLHRYLEMGADEVRIVSGYASPEMCTRLLLAARRLRGRVLIRLVVGMVGFEGVTAETHAAFLDLQSKPPQDSGQLDVRYVAHGLSVHSKLLIWLRRNRPLDAWMGSANFTQNGFGVGYRGRKHREIMTPTDVGAALAYFDAVEDVSIEIAHPELGRAVEIRQPLLADLRRGRTSAAILRSISAGSESVTLPLVALRDSPGTARGQVHARSGLNWGQRPEHRRDPNQAYIPIPAEVRRAVDFFPPRAVVFRVVTTDDQLLLMAVAQDDGKALHTTQDNGLLGEYFRRRLDVPDGARVDVADLNRFGSRFVTFYRVDDESEEEPTYVMDYSPEQEARGAEFYRV